MTKMKRLMETLADDCRQFLEIFKLKVTDIDELRLKRAYMFSMYGHYDQFRDGGQPYFEHLKATAIILAVELKIYDADLIIAALLHDMLEDNFLLDHEQIGLEFGPRVQRLVIGVTKPKKNDPRFAGDSHARHNFYFTELRKQPADTKILKLADRLHNLRTLDECSPDKKDRKIKETKEIYVPLIKDIIVKHPEVAVFFEREFQKCFQQLLE